MAVNQFSIDQDLREAREMADVLEPYLQQNELYLKISGNLPNMTVGSLLMRLHRLAVLDSQMSDKQRKTLQDIQTRHVKLRSEWSMHYGQKLVREANSRLDNLQAYLGECGEDEALCASAYPTEALRRTIIQSILAELDTVAQPSAEIDSRVKQVDSQLRQYNKPSDFVWPHGLEAAYPPAQFWWLYSRPPVPENN